MYSRERRLYMKTRASGRGPVANFQGLAGIASLREQRFLVMSLPMRQTLAVARLGTMDFVLSELFRQTYWNRLKCQQVRPHTLLLANFRRTYLDRFVDAPERALVLLAIRRVRGSLFARQNLSSILQGIAAIPPMQYRAAARNMWGLPTFYF